MAIISYQSEHARAAWKSCTASAFRTALACTVVGCITLFGPASFKQQIAFPAFSYVTVILIVTDATLGDTLRGCRRAFYASILGACPAFLILWLIGPARMTVISTAAVVALNAFLVVLPENSHLISKRIALGQIVIVYVLAFINGSRTDPVMHPVHVLASTAVGVVACVLAMLLPYPNLASYEVKKNSKLFSKNASERLKVLVKAFSADNETSALALISQAKSLAKTGSKLLKSIKSKQESMLWERLPLKFFKPHCMNPGDKLQDLEMPLKGMEIALLNCEPFPIKILNSELKADVARIEEHISGQVKRMPHVSAITVPEPNSENIFESLQALQTIPGDRKELPSFFFFFCLKLLQKKTLAAPTISSNKEGSADSQKEEEWLFKLIWRSLVININNKRLMAAFKCSLSLGLAVFFGSIYSKENGHWAGLTVAISLASAREATFKVANVKAQGTVLGTVYGVVGCIVFGKYVQTRFLSLLPWFIFCSFLRRSRMYGRAGGISAVIGAVLILGRTNFGPPSEFAIARITETFIGLSCSIMVELVLHPTRASALARVQLSKNLQMLRDSVGCLTLSSSKVNLDESLKKLKIQLNELGKFIGEAEVEPDFWFLPFHSACYGKLLDSLSMMLDIIAFTAHAIESLQQESGRINSNLWKENVNKLNLDLEIFKHMIGSSLKCYEEASLKKSFESMDKQTAPDLELGKSTIPSIMMNTFSDYQEMIEKNLCSYLEHCKELVDGINVDKGEEEIKSQIVLSLSCVAFCMNGLLRETKEIEKGIKELVQWENPSAYVNLHDISCKASTLAAAPSNI